MLVGDRFRESSRKEIVLHDIDSDAFRYFLDFLYNGKHFSHSFKIFSSVFEQIDVNSNIRIEDYLKILFSEAYF